MGANGGEVLAAGFDALAEVGDADAEGFGDPGDATHAEIAGAALDVGDVGAVETGFIAELLLCQAFGASSGADVGAEGVKE